MDAHGMASSVNPREFCGWPGKFRKDLENREKSGNLKIHGYGRQAVFRKFSYSIQEGKECTFS